MNRVINNHILSEPVIVNEKLLTDFPQYHYRSDGIEVQTSQRSYLPGRYTTSMQAEIGYRLYLAKCSEYRDPASKRQVSREKSPTSQRQLRRKNAPDTKQQKKRGS